MTAAPAERSFSMVGTEARTRPSSVIVVPSSGTFRSARSSTFLPVRSPSESMVFSMVFPVLTWVRPHTRRVRGRTHSVC